MKKRTQIKGKVKRMQSAEAKRVPAAYVIHHEGRDGSANLVVGLGFSMRTQQDEEKPARVREEWQQMESGQR